MTRTARRLLTGPLLVAVLGAGLVAAPQAASAAAGVTATVEVSSTLQVRSAPSLTAKAVGTLHPGEQIKVNCQVQGQRVRGSVRTSAAWDRIGAGRYVSHAYVSTSRSVPVCAAASPVAVPTKVKARTPVRRFVVGTVKSTEGKVNLRSGPSTSAAVVGTIATGRTINLLCAVAGENVTGTVRTTAQWDRTSTGTYLSHGFIYSGPVPACTGSTLPPPVVTLTPEQFIRASVPGAQKGWREFGVPPSVTIAQAILESGWGRSGLAAVDKNYFGIKCQNGGFGKLANGCHTYVTDECTKAGVCFTTTGVFRTYASQAHSFRDHGNFLRVNPRYAGAFAYTKSANKFIWKVWKAGYATDPNYYGKVTGIMASWNLYQYDTWK